MVLHSFAIKPAWDPNESVDAIIAVIWLPCHLKSVFDCIYKTFNIYLNVVQKYDYLLNYRMQYKKVYAYINESQLIKFYFMSAGKATYKFYT